jgi:hypothetical protein
MAASYENRLIAYKLTMKYTSAFSLMMFSIVCVFIAAGCNSKQSSSPPVVFNWTNALNSSTPTIMTDSWDKAEASWMHLELSATNLNTNEINLWLQLQVEIFDKTKGDPLKDQVRIMAVQEIGHFPQEGRLYLPWLKDGLSTNLFKEPEVKQKAEDVIQKLENKLPLN